VQHDSRSGLQWGDSLLPSKLLSPYCVGYLWLFRLVFAMCDGDLSDRGGLMYGF